MSSVWKKPTSSVRQQENAWMNSIFQNHDFWCHCDDPWLHFLIVLNKNSNAPKPEAEIRNIKWLVTGKPTIPTTTEENVDGLEPGDLEKLFAEDGGNEKDDPEDIKR